MAAREYQKRLLLLYEALDPSAFLQALLPLRKKRMDASNRCTTLVHIANGYLYGGQPQQALAVLEDVQPPETVSYTHLDVYKRQVLFIALITCYLCSEFLFAHFM